MTQQEQLKYGLDNLKSIKYQLKVLQDNVNNALEEVEELMVAIRLSPYYEEEH